MLKNVILQHKLEKEKLLANKYIKREKLSFAEKLIESDLIKVISGHRRSGKSVFSFLLLKDKNFAYVNFDDEKLIKTKNTDDIIKGIFEVYADPKYIFFDEIQNLDGWEIFTNKLHRRGYNLILTGSSARLLSKEFATNLTGRHINIEIFPFSFSEFLLAQDYNIKEEELDIPETKGKLLNYFEAYLKNGGFPEVVVKKMEPEIYLQTLFDAVLLKDVVKRYKIRYPQKLYDLAVYLISNTSSEFSFTKLKNILDFRSTHTIQNYLSYLEESYLFFILNRFSFKAKEQIKSPKKIYIIDNGFIQAKAFQFSNNFGKLTENLTFIGALAKGYRANKDIFYYKTNNGKEIDFVLKKGITIEKLIQVCYKIEDYNTAKREISALIEAGKELNCGNLEIITWDKEAQEMVNGKKIIFTPLWKWLLK
ncbi:MAG: ATP-binding protein [Armatimonadota bacterium]